MDASWPSETARAYDNKGHGQVTLLLIFFCSPIACGNHSIEQGCFRHDGKLLH